MKIICLLFIIITLGHAVSKKIHAHECVKTKSCSTHDFEQIGRVSPDELIKLSFAVKLKNVEKLYQVLNEVSDPKSENFGKHWTYDQVSELTSNSEATDKVVKHILKFVKDKSQIKTSKDGTFVRVKTTAKTAEALLSSEFQQFRSNQTGELLSRTLEFELPTEISDHVDYVFPTTQFPTTVGKRSVIVSQARINPDQRNADQKQERWTDFITPTILKSFYNISSSTVTNPKATQSVYATGRQAFSAVDLKSFQKKFGLPKVGVKNIVGTNDPNSCASYLTLDTCLEASLDVQYITSTAQKSSTTFWSTPVINFASWIEEVSSSLNPPLVHSISYGLAEAYVDASEQQRFSEEAARLGLRGVTIVAASGDDGVSLYGARDDIAMCGFRVPFPANVPYVLTVGATMGPESGSQEIACSADKGSIITTGGGFSTLFSRPDYQNSHVQQYLSNAQRTSPTYFPSSSMFNSNGRAIPDVAIAGNNFHVIIAKMDYQVSGTSASAPVFAGILTLANNVRLNRGKSSLGFVNPVLYSLFNSQPTLFNDVTSGDNRCAARPYSGGSPVCCPNGFSCASGWDPVTGLGSVNVGRLVNALADL